MDPIKSGGLPSETLKNGLSEVGVSAGSAKRDHFKGICPSAHLSKAPLQVFSGETTPPQRIESPTVTKGVTAKIFSL